MQTKPLKDLEIEGLYTTTAPTLPVQPEKNDAVIIKNVAWILISAIVLILVGIILKKYIGYTVINLVLHESFGLVAFEEITSEIPLLLTSSLR